MTEDELFAKAWETREAIKSGLHSGELEKAAALSADLNELQARIKAREDAHEAAMADLRAFHVSQVESGAEPAADNAEAETVILTHPMGFSDQQMNIHQRGFVDPVVVPNEFSSSRANGAYSED